VKLGEKDMYVILITISEMFVVGIEIETMKNLLVARTSQIYMK
jgi:hypothetical protein